MDYSTKLEQIKERAKTDLFFFTKEILGYKDLEEQPHRELCDFLLQWNKRKKLILLPRSSFKSTVITVGHIIHSLCYNPNLSTIISTENYQNCIKYLKEIKDHFEHNETLRLVYGDMTGREKGSWTRTEITLGSKTQVGGKDPSIQVTSTGNTKVGAHAELIVMDDLVSNVNTCTRDQIDKVIDYYKYMLSIANPEARLIIVGTRYTFSDLYAYIQENEKDNFDILIRGCTKDGTYDFREDNLYFPKRLTADFLEEQRKSQGSFIFSNQYMNKCVDADSQIFKENWIQYYTTPPQDLYYFITIDPAATVNKTSDYTAILVIGIDYQENIYLIELHQLKESPSEWIDLVFRKCKEYGIGSSRNAGSVSIETNSWQQVYKAYMVQEMNSRNFPIPIVEAKPCGSMRGKEQRIGALVPFFEQGKIFFKKNQYAIVDELLMFPKGKNDDCIDALKDIIPIMIAPPAPLVISKLDKATTLTYNEKMEWANLEKAYNPRYVKRKFRSL